MGVPSTVQQSIERAAAELDAAGLDWHKLFRVRDLLMELLVSLEVVSQTDIEGHSVEVPEGPIDARLFAMRGALEWVRDHEYTALETEIRRYLETALQQGVDTLGAIDQPEDQDEGGPHVLVVEDDPEILDLVNGLLAMKGLAATAILDPSMLERQLAHTRPDLFVIDVMLQGESGIDVAQRMERQGFETVPRIAISASESMIQAARESELFVEVIPKPFEIGELLEAVDRHLTRGSDPTR